MYCFYNGCIFILLLILKCIIYLVADTFDLSAILRFFLLVFLVFVNVRKYLIN